MENKFETQIAKMAKFYIGKQVAVKGEQGIVTDLKMMAAPMVSVKFQNRTGIYKLNEIEMSTPNGN
jgi:hypothetical protein